MLVKIKTFLKKEFDSRFKFMHITPVFTEETVLACSGKIFFDL